MSRRWPVNGVVLALLWLFVRGVEVSPPVRLAEEFLIGLVVGMPVAYLSRRFYSADLPVERSVRAVPYALFYVAAFLWELLKANLAVAYIVLSPSMPVNPAVVELPLRVQNDVAITTIANSITLTPGTLTMDHDRERNALYVHSIRVPDGDVDSVVEPIRRWEDYALVIFDEELKPGDPVPEPARTADGTATEPTSGGEFRGD